MAALQGMLRATRLGVVAARACARDLATLSAMAKSDFSPVTVADFVVQCVVISSLLELGPVPIVAEEASDSFYTLPKSAQLDVARRVSESLGKPTSIEQVAALLDCGGTSSLPSHGLVYVLDPIDGTKGFLRGEQYAVALGRIEDGVPVAGVLGCPNLANHDNSEIGCIFAAQNGEGAHEFDLDGNLRLTLGASSPTHDSQGVSMMESFESSHFVGAAHERIAQACNVKRIVKLDSQVKYGVLARGGGHILPRVTTHDNLVWDIAPGAAILAEAGGRITDGRGQPLRFTEGRSVGSKVVLCSAPGCGALHDTMVSALVSSPFL